MRCKKCKSKNVQCQLRGGNVYRIFCKDCGTYNFFTPMSPIDEKLKSIQLSEKYRKLQC